MKPGNRMYIVALSMILGITFSPAQSANDSITIGMQLEPPHLNPTAGAAAAIDEVVYANIFEGLTRFNPDGSIRPALAKSWDVSEDGLIYTFHLQGGVQFHDGNDFDASDVKFSLDRARAEDSTNAQKALFADIRDVSVIDPMTVQVSLNNPNGLFPVNMAWGDAIIMDPASADTAETKPIGTGPFMFKNWAEGDRVEIVKNPDYWGEEVALEAATFKFISDPTAAFGALMTGDIDAFPAFPSPETLGQFEADPRFRVIVGSTEGETILSTNNKADHLSDIRVRKAIAHAINRQELIDGAMFGYGTAIGTHFAPHHPDYLDLTGESMHEPELARQILRDAGYDDGLSLRLHLPPPSYARRGGEIIASQLRAVGIETEIINVEWGVWLEQVFRGKDFDLTIVSHTEPNDINIYARPEYYFQYDNAALQAVIEELRLTSDASRRTELAHEAQSVIARDYVNGYLFQLPKLGVASSKIVGLWENSPTQANDLTQVHWTD